MSSSLVLKERGNHQPRRFTGESHRDSWVGSQPWRFVVQGQSLAGFDGYCRGSVEATQRPLSEFQWVPEVPKSGIAVLSVRSCRFRASRPHQQALKPSLAPLVPSFELLDFPSQPTTFDLFLHGPADLCL